MREDFRPVALSTSTGLLGKFKFGCRIALDLQVASVYRSIRGLAQGFSGTILDVGCGASPYKFLFDANKTKYVGIDIVEADQFDYCNSEVISFNGKEIPFADNTYDGVMCTEVLEHVHEYQTLVDEIHRVMKPGSVLMLTVPWSARYHYIPYDFFRYTPSTLNMIFKDFTDVRIIGRGTDITSIVAKILVIWFRNLLPSKGSFNIVTFLLALLFTPFVLPLACLGHLSMQFALGSDDDPLGYSAIATK